MTDSGGAFQACTSHLAITPILQTETRGMEREGGSGAQTAGSGASSLSFWPGALEDSRTGFTDPGLALCGNSLGGPSTCALTQKGPEVFILHLALSVLQLVPQWPLSPFWFLSKARTVDSVSQVSHEYVPFSPAPPSTPVWCLSALVPHSLSSPTAAIRGRI